MSAYTVWTKPTQKADTPMSCSLLADLQPDHSDVALSPVVKRDGGRGR